MKKGIIITAAGLLMSVSNYFGIVNNGSIRTIEFLSIIAIGIFVGVLLTQIITTVKNKNKIS